MPPKTKGRPAGSPNVTAAADVLLSACPACKSTRRGPYQGRTEQTYRGRTPDGREYSTIVWRRCQCLQCGQWRIDRSFEFDPEPAQETAR